MADIYGANLYNRRLKEMRDASQVNMLRTFPRRVVLLDRDNKRVSLART